MTGRGMGGFTLIEMVAVLVLAGLLAMVALPSFDTALRKARRADALGAAAQVQGAQERLRSQGPRYGSLAELGLPAQSAAGHYVLEIRSFDANGYELYATATGLQARDTYCRVLALRSNAMALAYASGPDAGVANSDAVNRSCWSL